MAAYDTPARNEALVLKILKQLCITITGLKDDAVVPHFTNACVILGGNLSESSNADEFELGEKIKKKFVRHRRERDAVVFSELHRKLRSQTLLKDRGAILQLLYSLSEANPAAAAAVNKYRGLSFSQGLSASLISTPQLHQQQQLRQSTLASSGSNTTASSIGFSSGFSSIPGSYSRNDPSPTPQSLLPSAVQTPFTQHGLQAAAPRTLPSVGQRLIKTVDRSEPPSTVTNRSSVSLAAAVRTPKDLRSGDSTIVEMAENDILKDVLFALQGIDGRCVKYDGVKEAFIVDPKAGLPKTARKTVCKLAECGHLFMKIRKYADTHSADRAFGLVGQGFCAALNQELTEYYRLIAVLAAQLQQEDDPGIVCDSPSCLTLRRLSVWTCEPVVRLKTLAALVDVCNGKKGGALATAVHSYMQHGDPTIRSLVRHTLAVVAQPIFSTILRWIYEGELEDTYHEFFVASDQQVKDDRLWHDKYSLRTEMVPSFLSVEQAKKILLTGKAINFLRQVCQDRTLIRNREVVRIAEANRVESMFTQDLDGVFDKMVDTVYKETSRHLLHVLHTKYKFMDHLKAMRRYLLLGQGDFIRHLMDLLEEDLAKPAQTLFLHNLTGILETAVRATNAQYDDADILKRLDVRLLEVSPGDTGWDVFSLEYHVSGHIRTVFTTECMMMYLRVFNFLWRAKRMEYVLSMIWKEQMANARLLRPLPEVEPALHQCRFIVSEMLHFVQQIQYYINFEVLECSWDELLCKVKEAEDLDHIIAAHQEFLDAITTRSLLDPQSHAILTQLRTIFDLIINFQVIQDNMYRAAKDELYARQSFEQTKARNTEMGTWGVTEDEEEAEQRRRTEFSQTVLSTSRSQLRILQQSYQNMVQQFLVMLTSQSDVSLRFLSFRLDFNEHYRALEQKSRTRRSQQFQQQKKRT